MRRLAYIALASALLASSSMAGSQKPSGAETGLLGVHLYDSSLKVITMFGSPNDIEGVTIGDSSGGGGGGAAPAGGGGPAGPGGSHGSTAGPTPGHSMTEFDSFGDSMLQSSNTIKPHSKTFNPLAGTGGNGQTLGGMAGGGSIPGAAGASNTGSSSAAGGGASQEVKFTRWIYNRSGSKYGFVIDNFARVVQIEAIGMGNPKVHTARGIRFGSTFGQIIKRYNTRNSEGGTNAPDGYEVSGDSVTVRYLVKNKVSFRLNRLSKDGPQVVTAIAVSAGKQ
jgi:hypothetical protein